MLCLFCIGVLKLNSGIIRGVRFMLYILYFSKVMYNLVVEYFSLGYLLIDFKLVFVWSSRVFRLWIYLLYIWLLNVLKESIFDYRIEIKFYDI